MASVSADPVMIGVLAMIALACAGAIVLIIRAARAPAAPSSAPVPAAGSLLSTAVVATGHPVLGLILGEVDAVLKQGLQALARSMAASMASSLAGHLSQTAAGSPVGQQLLQLLGSLLQQAQAPAPSAPTGTVAPPTSPAKTS